MKKQIFQYGGFHFIPERKFTAAENDFFKISHKQRIDRQLGFCIPGYIYESKYTYSYEGFYEAATDKKCDLFRCVENGKLYLPCQNDLQEYIEFLEKRNMLNPLYRKFRRLGCWFCVKQSLDSLRVLRHDYPEYWKIMMEWDRESLNTFKPRYRVADLDQRFSAEEGQLRIITNEEELLKVS